MQRRRGPKNDRKLLIVKAVRSNVPTNSGSPHLLPGNGVSETTALFRRLNIRVDISPIVPTDPPTALQGGGMSETGAAVTRLD